MNDLEKIAEALQTTVRFAQSTGDAPTLDADLVTPTSARLIYHPLLTNENLFTFCPEENIASVAFNDWLRDLRLEASREVFDDIMRRKKTDQVTKEMLDNFVLYSGVGRFNDQITKRGRRVGYEIRLLNSNNIKVIIERIMLQFSAIESFDLYLYYSENPVAIATIPVTTSVAGKAEWTALGQELNFRDFDNNIAGGVYYLMYDEDELTGQAVTRKLSFSSSPCVSCDRGYYNRYTKFSQYVKLRSVSVSSANKPSDPTEMFDINQLAYEPDNTYGLNFALTSYCDITDYVVNHKDIFADALAKQVVFRLMQALLSSTRSNVIVEKIKENARFALQNADIGGENLVKDLDKAKNAVGFELSDIQNSVCMPSIAAKGVKYGTVGGANPQNRNYGYHRN